MKCFFIGLVAVLVSLNGFTQGDTTSTKDKRNIIKWNLTPMIIVGPKSFVVSYERVLKNRNSISVTAGRLELPPLSNRNGEVFEFSKNVERGGYDFAMDYRMYFKNRNKFDPPDGLYWGPFASLYNLNFEGESKIYNDGVEVNRLDLRADIFMYNLGIQLGYQFIIKDLFSIDLHLFGPSVSRYVYSFDIESDATIDPDGDFYTKYEEFIQKLFPGGDIVFDDLDFTTKSKSAFNFFGFRYGVQIGYYF